MSPKKDPQEAAEHAHKDPRGAAPGGGPEARDHTDVRGLNYGQVKNRRISRLDKPVNWYRRAPHPPERETKAK